MWFICVFQNVDPEFESDARVVWCRDCGADAELGVEFLNTEEAAIEWISHFAIAAGQFEENWPTCMTLACPMQKLTFLKKTVNGSSAIN